jgi:phosphorylcholine metabolism protein LicD
MEIPYKFFEDEVREGFYISGLIKRSWASQIEVLQEVDKVCKKHNIRWFADCGTLIGTVRHAGYVPWDDDLDICMLRPDYDKFRMYAEKELPDNYVVLSCYKEDETYYEHMLRIASEHRLNFDENFLEKYHDNPYATGIDIFPLDYIADDEEEEQERKDLLSLLMPLCDEVEPDGSNLDEYMDVISQVQDICKFKIDFKRSVKHQLFQMTEKIFALYSQQGGKHVALMPYWVYFDNHKYLAEYFDKTIMMPFEFTEMPVPAAYDAVLRIEYGDYMRIVKGGGVHDYPCYELQENHLIEIVDDYPFKYRFKKEDLKNDDRVNHEKPRSQAVKFLGIMDQAHQAIVVMLAKKQYDTVLSLLESCQNGAINIGNLLEKRYGEGYETVKLLEEYCEIIYQVGELISQVDDTGALPLSVDDIAAYLTEIYVAVSESINRIPDRKEILFMPVRAEDWPALDSVWRTAKAEENTDVYVMPVPYYERTALGGFSTMHYEGELFPEYLDIVNYEDYDIGFRHPDEIIIQNAYDQCNYTTCIDPKYFSKNIKAYTDKLVYIPWFKLDELDGDGEKAKKVMQYYCTIPGLSHADVVVVQSEQTRQAYIDRLTEFAGEDTRSVWEEKIVAGGSPLDEWERNKKALIDRKKIISELDMPGKELLFDADGNIKKILLYNTTVASYMQNGEKLLSKIERNLEVFKENSDKLAVIWKPHPQLRTMISSTSPKLVHRYDRLVREFGELKLGVFDQNADIGTLVKICDAYYGDADGIAHRCQVEGLPVMVQSVEQ